MRLKHPGEIDFEALAETIYRCVNGGSFDLVIGDERARWLRAARSVVPQVVGDLAEVVTAQANAFQELVNRGGT